MLIFNLCLAVCLGAAEDTVEKEPAQHEGIIGGIVVNASDGDTALPGVDVVLSTEVDNHMTPVAKTTTDWAGKFLFKELPVGMQYRYRPGANHDEIHYPGPDIRLNSQQWRVGVELAVHESVAEPSPLVIRRHDVLIEPEAGALKVTESILVDNPSSRTYVGQAPNDESKPVTLCLNIPKDFDRTTFHKEFFGRRFSMIDERLVTNIPWTPGERELEFTYLLRNTKSSFVWQRPMDLPCSKLRIQVRTENPEQVTCNLPAEATKQHDGMTELVFESDGQTLAAGHVIRLQLGAVPVPWMTYARWGAVIVLGVLIAGTGAIVFRRRRSATPKVPHRKRKTSTRRAA